MGLDAVEEEHGGLLICFGEILQGTGTFSCAGYGNEPKSSIGEGSCGGGSINVFYNDVNGDFNTNVNLEKVELKSNTILLGNYTFVDRGCNVLANGGDGTATLGSIKTGRFLQDF